LSKLQKTNEESVQLIGQLSSQCDVLVKEVNDFQQSLVELVPVPVDPVVPSPIEPMPVEPITVPVDPIVPIESVPIDPTTIEPIITPTDLIDPITQKTEVTVAKKSNLVSSSWTHDGSFIPWSHKLMWDGKKYKSVSI
jgi:hypothetical protein